MINNFIKSLTRNPICIRGENFIFVWFGPIVGLNVGIAVTVTLVLAHQLDNKIYVTFFNQYFILFPIVLVLGSIAFFQGFWFNLGAIIKRIFSKEKYEWRRPGAVFYGGFLGCVSYGLILGYVDSISPWCAADLAFLLMPFAHGLSRLACLNFGCCYGKRCSESHWMRVSYTHPQSEPVRHGSVHQHRHPVQLYELLLCISLGIVLWSMVGKVGEGKIFASYLVGYGVIRFLLEFIRDNTHEFQIWEFSIWQILSLCCSVIGVILLLTLKNSPPLTFINDSGSLNIFKYAFIGLWNAIVISISFGLHFRKKGESL